MSLLNIFRDETAKWYRQPPAEETSIQKLLAALRFDLPEDFLAFLRFSNGGEGSLTIEPGWFQLWPAEELVMLNRDYEVQHWLPHLLGFGSDGGGELLAFDTSVQGNWPVCMVPFGDFEAEAILPVALDFATFVRAMGQKTF